MTTTSALRVPKPSRRTGNQVGLVWQVLAFVVAGGIWWATSQMLPANAMPSPAEVIQRLAELATTPKFWSVVGSTTLSFAIALALSIAIGVPLGLAIGSSDFATGSTRLLLDFLRTIPPVAILPLLLLILGPTMGMIILLSVVGSIWPILIQSVYAARQGEALLTDMAKSFRIPHGWYLRHIFVPGTVPFVMTGLRLGATICLLLTVAGQLLGSAPGIGYEIAEAQAYYDNSRMYAYVVVSGIMGMGINALFWAAQQRVLRWHPSTRGGTK